MIKFPKLIKVYLCNEVDYSAEYCDYGRTKYGLGKNPIIILNYSKTDNKIRCMMHETIHFLTRPLPEWLEKFIDVSIDVTEGNHDKEEVYELKIIIVKLVKQCQQCLYIKKKYGNLDE